MKRFESFLSARLWPAVLTLILLISFSSSGFAGHEKSLKKGYLGVSVTKISPSDLKKMSLTHGIEVMEVVEGEAAEKAGIKEGDVIQYVDKQIIHTPGDLSEEVRKRKPGTQMNINLVRKGKSMTLSVNLGKLKSHDYFFASPGKNKYHFHIGEKAYLGIQLRRLNDDLAGYFGVKEDNGVLVLKVMEGTPAEKAGLKAGDVIVRMGDEKISTPEDIHDFLDDHESGDKIKLTVIRHKKNLALTAELEKSNKFHKFNFYRGIKDGKAVISIPEFHVPQFHIEIPDGEECKIIIRENLDKVKEKLKGIKEKVHKKLRYVSEYIYI